MAKALGALFLLVLAGCSAMPAYRNDTPSPCMASEASYECQIERYNNVNVE